MYEFGDCILNVNDQTLLCGGKNVVLTPEEFKLLHLFLRRSEDTLSREEILNSVWGHSHFITVRDVDRLVDTLKSKIEPNPNTPVYIHAKEMVGYMFKRPQTNGNYIDS